ncbi:MAG TPA: class I SAM-dependent methyltransferase [Armatimonadota bacterium]|nr:class I SAM-dependent methyltransferase [Armatimonadota bacterium]HOS42089.1 class I SAM-dependent methyltransferase [Armatimonadota bacterium]
MDAALFDEMYRLETTHWWFTARRAILLRLLRRYLPPAAERRIVDLGCGTGAFLDALASLGDAVGVDSAPEAVAYSARRGVSVRPGALPDHLPLSPDSADLVTLLDVLEHLEDDAAGLRAAARLLRPGGLLLCTVPAFEWLWSGHDTLHAHRRRYTRAGLRALLVDAGLAPVRVSYFNTWLLPAIAGVRLLRGGRRAAPRSDAQPVAAPYNALLRAVFASEGWLLPRCDLPIGVSLVALATRPPIAQHEQAERHAEGQREPDVAAVEEDGGDAVQEDEE